MIDNTAIYQLLSVAQLVAPSGKEQEAFTTLVHRMQNARESNKAIFTALLGAISDGVNYGNWPVVEADIND